MFNGGLNGTPVEVTSPGLDLLHVESKMPCPDVAHSASLPQDPHSRVDMRECATRKSSSIKQIDRLSRLHSS